MSTPRAVQLPGQTYATLAPAKFGDLCQGLAHGVDGPMVLATSVASVSITLDIVAQVYLCGPCTDALVAATVSAGG